MSFLPLKGVTAASVTPIAADFSLDTGHLAAHLRRLLDEGCTFVSCFGTTGEGSSFSTGQKLDALQALKAAGLDMSRQIPGVMTPVFEDAVAMVRGAYQLGCRAALVLPPFYYAASDEGLAAFFRALVSATADTPIDIVLYNIPQVSGIRFSHALIETLLAEHGARIAGIKDSTGDLENGLQLVARFPELAVLTGDDRVLPKLVAAGGAGMIGGMPNLCARELVALYAAPQGADADEIVEKQTRRILAVDANGSLVALKALLARHQDPVFGTVIPPLTTLDKERADALEAEFLATGFDFAGRS